MVKSGQSTGNDARKASNIALVNCVGKAMRDHQVRVFFWCAACSSRWVWECGKSEAFLSPRV